MKKDDNGAPTSFRTLIEKIKIERLMKQHIKNVELDPTLSHFIWNGLDTIQYQVIQGDYEVLKSVQQEMLVENATR